MVKMIVVFLAMFAAVNICIVVFRSMTNAEKWSLTKSAGYAIIVAAVSTLLLTSIVFLF